MANGEKAIDVEELKRTHSLDDTVTKITGEELKPTQRKIHCPFHADHSPSLHVYKDGSWHCYGCGKNGDLLDFIGYYKYGNGYEPNRHFLEIVDYLGALEIKPVKQPATAKLPVDKPKLTVDMTAIQMWHQTMPTSRRMYWHDRGLTKETIDKFLLGWNGRRYTIPAIYRNIPFGVKLRQSELDDGIDAKYIQVNGSRVGIFNSDILQETDRVIICEGEVDAMLLSQLNYPAVTSTGGAATFRKEWARFFTHIKEIYIMFDNDEPGRLGAMNVKHILRRAKICELPDGIKDVGELLANYEAPVSWLFNQLW